MKRPDRISAIDLGAVHSSMCMANIKLAMQQLTGVNYLTSKQHKDVTKARQNRDAEDTSKLLEALKDWEPFAPDPSLQSIYSGVLANSKVNVDNAKQVGESILNDMKGRSVGDYKFRHKDQAITLTSGSSIKVHRQQLQVDPVLLFQRLTTLANKHDDSKSLFEFELCSHPASLFESSSLPRKANKPALADAVWDLAIASEKETELTSTDGRTAYVLDGGAILHCVPWQCGLTFHELCQLYVSYINKRYQQATIVFDGHDSGPSIKDATHRRQRQTAGKTSTTVHLTTQMIKRVKKDEFLANNSNKQRFINLLGRSLSNAEHKVVHVKDDADVPIVLAAIESVQSCDTVVVGEDTDLLILLCLHANIESHDLFLVPEDKMSSKKHRV